MNSIIAFVLAFASILIIAAVARYAAGYFASDRSSRAAGFGVALGYAAGRYSYSGAATAETLPTIAAGLGVLLALVVAWALLLRKRTGELAEG